LQSQVNKAAKKRLSLSGLEILHGRLIRFAPLRFALLRAGRARIVSKARIGAALGMHCGAADGGPTS
jgi:hypothetical protein